MTRNKIIRAVTVSMSCVFFEDVMRRLRADGYEMVVVSSPGIKLEKLREEGFRCIEVPMERQISLLKDINSLWNMIKVFRKEQPDMVHSMTPKAGLICMLAAWMVRVPVRVHTFTGLVWPTSSGIKRRILMLTDRITCACATHIIPEGQGVLDDLKNGRITRKEMRVLGYGNVRGVDMKRFDPIRFTAVIPRNRPFSFLFVGRIVGDKGINELVKAFIRLKGIYPNLRLDIVGQFETELNPVSSEILEIMNSEPSIKLLGPKLGDDLVRTYAGVDCFVMPSYREGFPNTVLEAGAMGLPCIVTGINGSREIIENEKNGLVVPPKDTDALYTAMKRMYEDVELRGILRSNARPMIESRFEQNFVQQCLLDYYDLILAEVK